ncbi:Mur ligase family protein [Methanopyrus sp.]
MSADELPFDSVAVIGLGVEGRTCAARLAELGLEVYASDIREDVDVSSLEGLPNVEVDLGRHDLDRIRECDAVYFSPSIPSDAEIVREVRDVGVPPLEDLLTWPDSSEFIVVSGTNGKTTTVHMIDHLLGKLGVDRETGGNAGGGFDGYATLYVRAELARPEVVVCEVCDMTLDYFSDRAPRYDVAVFLNLGLDHLDYHGSLERYAARAARFCDRAREVAIVKCDGKERRVVERMRNTPRCYDKSDVEVDVPLRGEFYRLDAKAAVLAVAAATGEPPEELAPLLSDFTGVPGRVREYKLDGGRLIVGKTDNISALRAVLRDYGPLNVVFWGTPRPGEDYRIEGIGRALREAGVGRAYVFPGLSEETVDDVIEELSSSGIEAYRVEPSEVASKALKLARRGRAVGVLGNGQDVITSIQRDVERAVRFLAAKTERPRG